MHLSVYKRLYRYVKGFPIASSGVFFGHVGGVARDRISEVSIDGPVIAPQLPVTRDVDHIPP